jgi:hypothetical protein
MNLCIGRIYKLKDGRFEAGPLVSADPIKTFDNPHAAEQYLRDTIGTHPVVKTECLPLHQTNGDGWPLGACGVWVIA